jgi:WD40 repeat protein
MSPKETLMTVSSSGAIAVLQGSATVVLRDAHADQELMVLAMELPVSSVRFSADGRFVALALDNGSLLRVWNVQTGNLFGEFPNPEPQAGSYSIEFAPSGESLWWYSPTSGRSLDLLSGEFGPPITFAATVLDSAFGSDGRLLVAASDGSLSLWDTSTAALLESRMGVSAGSVDFASGAELAVVSTDESVWILESSSLASEHSLNLRALDVVFDPTGKALAVVGADGEISVWASR